MVINPCIAKIYILFHSAKHNGEYVKQFQLIIHKKMCVVKKKCSNFASV